MPDSYTLMARANIGNFNRNRDLTKQLRKMRKTARKDWRQQKQAKRKFKKQNKGAQTVGMIKLNTGIHVLTDIKHVCIKLEIVNADIADERIR